jgi:hypothetical protein
MIFSNTTVFLKNIKNTMLPYSQIHPASCEAAKIQEWTKQMLAGM